MARRGGAARRPQLDMLRDKPRWYDEGLVRKLAAASCAALRPRAAGGHDGLLLEHFLEQEGTVDGATADRGFRCSAPW